MYLCGEERRSQTYNEHSVLKFDPLGNDPHLTWLGSHARKPEDSKWRIMHFSNGHIADFQHPHYATSNSPGLLRAYKQCTSTRFQGLSEYTRIVAMP